MALEFDALQRQGTWILVPRKLGQNVVGCRQVYKIKHQSNDTIERRKA